MPYYVTNYYAKLWHIIKTESKGELEEIDIKNRACYYFDVIMRILDIDFYKTLLDEKSYENILIYDITYKTFKGAKSLSIRFDKIDGMIKSYDGTRYLVLFIPERYHAIPDWIKYIISEKSGITYSIIHNFTNIKVDSSDSSPLEKTMTLHVIILIRSVCNKDKNNYCRNIFLEKACCELSKK